ncbi:hypothetical protein LIA77_05995 [Sarocladium implicatum]|nr:hypothetical protein LIA77_05995 [Sarocladium implicatum]
MLSAAPGVIFLLVVLFGLHTWSADVSADPAERKVFETGFYTVLGGVAVNTICAAVTWGVGAVPVGDEFGACTPYGLAGSAVSARLHLYKNSYGPREWMYLKSMPQVLVTKLGGLTDLALDRLDDELLKRGVIKTKPGQKRRQQAEAWAQAQAQARAQAHQDL